MFHVGWPMMASMPSVLEFEGAEVIYYRFLLMISCGDLMFLTWLHAFAQVLFWVGNQGNHQKDQIILAPGILADFWVPSYF